MNETVRKAFDNLVKQMNKDYNENKFDQEDSEGETVNDANHLLLGYIRQIETILTMAEQWGNTKPPEMGMCVPDNRVYAP